MMANTIDPTSPSRNDKSDCPVALGASYSNRLTNFQRMMASITIVPVMTASPATSANGSPPSCSQRSTSVKR
jgi:hypothetical protein